MRDVGLSAVILCGLMLSAAHAVDKKSPETWSFAVSGDSRNCGDVVMPAIAADAIKHNVAFYWHLGDLRLISGPDQDFMQERVHLGQPVNLAIYEKQAWDDFIENQMTPWGDVPFYLGIGNHEKKAPKSRAAFLEKFRSYLHRDDFREQPLRDDPAATQPSSSYPWITEGIDFITRDNATEDQFDAAQMKWLSNVIARAAKDDEIDTEGPRGSWAPSFHDSRCRDKREH